MAEQKVLAASGDLMIAHAFRQADPDVLAAYPITPQTIIVEEFDVFVANGEVNTEFVTVESEHSAMSASVGASAAGARTATATASQGLALMWEELHIASGMRLPIVMANANRALSAPINIHGDHSDVMGARDTGWIIMFAEDAQEAYDNSLMAFRIAEHPNVKLPVMTTLDGFITSHALERCELMDDVTAKAFLGKYEPEHYLLDTDHPTSHGMFAMGNIYMENKLAERKANEAAIPVIDAVGQEWAEISGRPWTSVKTYGMEDAERAIVVLGSSAGNARHYARQLREQGEKVGVVSMRLFRPFPADMLVDALKNVKSIAVLDRAEAFGAQVAPLCADVMSALYKAGLNIPVRNYIYGLGGADVTGEIIETIFDDLKDPDAVRKADITYMGNR